ncbi:unnamed protein product [Dracunculus medinensis]|uniref:ShTK domain protein n=1 Tax=Dracunculus medinensis TaxID=318479 RepID=A0A0N4UPR3_DRAME|nr:unnamed protein product [Dracunculus medinensis]
MTVAITECHNGGVTNDQPAQGETPRRPVPSASACHDNDQNGLCNALFPNDNIANNLNPGLPYKVHQNCFAVTHSSIATKFCASTCALCCKTPQFSSCPDTASNCTIFAQNLALCTSQQLSAFALERCAKTCGLCDKPGTTTMAASNCRDERVDCARHRQFCHVHPFSSYYSIFCRKTCEFC